MIFINADKATGLAGTLGFFQSDGSTLSVPLDQETASEFPYLLPAGGGQEFRPEAVTGRIARIILDPANPSTREVVVNEGNTIQLSPLVLDSAGDVVEGVSFSYTSLSPEIATVDAFGKIDGRRAGFSTLTISAGGVVTTATITVVKVTSGAAGFQITGVVQDLARRLYLANTRDHTILLAQDLESTPEVYAGVSQTPGLENDERLKSLFRNPAFLAFNQAQGTLYVSDGANHAIRLVEPGPDGRVRTLAGTGQAGSTDGSLNQAAFNNPQGIALDNGGHLWVTDSANHTIRRINLITRTVETIAGKVGSPGLVDGIGEEARFNSPVGIAIETESLAQQLDRERRGEPPPPVSVIVADTSNGVIRRLKESGEVETIGAAQQRTGSEEGRPDSLQFAQGLLMFDSPAGVGVDPFGNIYVTEPDSGQVKAILQNGDVLSVAQANTFVGPKGIVVGGSGRIVVATADRSAQQIAYGVPEISNITPDQVRNKGGAVITITGKNFAPDSMVVAGGVIVSDVVINDTNTISLVAPPLPSGRTTLTVQNRGGLAQRSLQVFPTPLSELPNGHITTVAGGSTFIGDGSAADSAAVGNPVGITLDAAGDLFIADSFNRRVRKVSAATGVITTVAGSGQIGFSGDNGPALAATFDLPQGVARDGADNLFIADLFNDRIRKVNLTTGIITAVAGGGPRPDRFGDEGLATEAALESPEGVAVEKAGNLFIADSFNSRIRKVDGTTGIITTVAGGGDPPDNLGDEGPATEARLVFPEGVAVDGAGNLFIAERVRIRKVDGTTGIITTVAGGGDPSDGIGDGGPATEALLFLPDAVALDETGNLFIVASSRIRKVDGTTGIITTVAGGGDPSDGIGDGGPAIEAALGFPNGLAVDGAGNLFIADTDNDRIRKVDAATGIITTVAGSRTCGDPNVPGGVVCELGDGSPAIEATLDGPEGVAVDGAGNLFIADTDNDRIRKVDGTTGIITTVAGGGSLLDSGIGDGGRVVSPPSRGRRCRR
ncbi:IPT/TIG domain-containing protein [Acidobacteria bacterium AH-259-D05]|nr:IPT/TIG domain-containing protein [Acidobacteria bacterium AH-259-D05]